MQTPDGENEAFLSLQILTYLGNKRKLLHFIGTGIQKVQLQPGRSKLSIFDVFSGSGIVVRYFKQFSRLLPVNDLEKYSAVMNQYYLSNQGDTGPLREYHRTLVETLATGPLKGGLLPACMPPRMTATYKPVERVFFIRRNAMYIDTARKLIDTVPSEF